MTKIMLTLFSLFMLLVFFTSSGSELYSQQKGEFDITHTYPGGEILLSFFVPFDYNPSKSYKLIVGFHPAQTPSQMMRMMLMPIATQLNAILLCPNNTDYKNDGIMEGIEHAKSLYNIDAANVVMTGYSAGGAPTFSLGLNNYTQFKGIIGIAPSISSITQQQLNIVDKFPICIIVGEQDGFKSYLDPIVNTLKEYNAIIKYIVKPGVGHTGPYFYSPDFVNDWLECYNFIQTAKPKPPAVTLSEPANNSSKLELPVTLKWNALEDVSEYLIHISTDVGFSVISDSTRVTSPEYTSSRLINNSVYYWRVAGVNEGGVGKWSSSWYFKTIMRAPDTAPIQFKPQNNTTGVKKTGVTLQWRPVIGVFDYNLQVFQGEAETPFIDVNLRETSAPQLMSYELTGLEYSNVYKWMVRCFNEGGYSPWHQEWQFTVEDDLTSVRDADIELFDATIIPNPASRNSLVKIMLSKSDNLTVSIYSLDGTLNRELFNGSASAGILLLDFNTSTIPSGIYFLSLRTGAGAVTKQFAVVK